jgi:hypothetical protein
MPRRNSDRGYTDESPVSLWLHRVSLPSFSFGLAGNERVVPLPGVVRRIPYGSLWCSTIVSYSVTLQTPLRLPPATSRFHAENRRLRLPKYQLKLCKPRTFDGNLFWHTKTLFTTKVVHVCFAPLREDTVRSKSNGFSGAARPPKGPAAQYNWTTSLYALPTH